MSKKFYSFLLGGALTALAAFAATEIAGPGIVGNDEGGYKEYMPAFSGTPVATVVDNKDVKIDYDLETYIYGSKVENPTESDWERIDNPGSIAGLGEITVSVSENGTVLDSQRAHYGNGGTFTLQNVAVGKHTYTLTAKYSDSTGVATVNTNEIEITAPAVEYPATLVIKGYPNQGEEYEYVTLKGANGVYTGELDLQANPKFVNSSFQRVYRQFCFYGSDNKYYYPSIGTTISSLPYDYSDGILSNASYANAYFMADTSIAQEVMEVTVDLANGTVKFQKPAVFKAPNAIRFMSAFNSSFNVTLTKDGNTWTASNVEIPNAGKNAIVQVEYNGNNTNYGPSQNENYTPTFVSNTWTGDMATNNYTWVLDAGKYNVTVVFTQDSKQITLTKVIDTPQPPTPTEKDLYITNAETKRRIQKLEKSGSAYSVANYVIDGALNFNITDEDGNGFMPEADVTVAYDAENLYTGAAIALTDANYAWTIDAGKYNIELNDGAITIKKVVTAPSTDTPNALYFFTDTGYIQTEYGMVERVGETDILKGTITIESQVQVIMGPAPMSMYNSYLPVSKTVINPTNPQNNLGKAIEYIKNNLADDSYWWIYPGTYEVTVNWGNPKTVKFELAKVPATGITLDATTKTLEVGESFTLKATVTPENHEGTVAWSSSNEEVATVDANGKVTAKAAGEVTISATINELTATCTVTVNKPVVDVDGIELNEYNIELEEGETFQLIATVSPEDATDKTVTWTSSDPNVATVDENGLVTAVEEGHAEIYAQAGSIVKFASVTVTKKVIAVESIELNKETLELVEGDTETLIATVTPENATDATVTWATSDEAVATVVDGVVTAVAEGTATITATAGDKSATCDVTVTKKVIAVETIELNLENISLYEGKTAVLTVSVNPENADYDEADFVWSSDNEEVATVENGVVTAVAAGEATITVTLGVHTATCQVVVEKEPVYEPVEVTTINTEIDVREGDVTVTWVALEGVEGYNVYLKKVDGASEIKAREEAVYGEPMNEEVLTFAEGEVPTFTFKVPEEAGNYGVVVEAIYPNGVNTFSEVKTFDVTGIDALLMDKTAVYYDLNGNKVVNPENGLYIRVANGKTMKVVIRK